MRLYADAVNLAPVFSTARRTFVCAAVAALLSVVAQRSAAWVSNNGYSWPTGTDIVMHLQLSRAAVFFQDGSASWNGSAADALRIWDEHLGTVRFVEAGPATQSAPDGVNSVYFSNTVQGQSFGPRVLAVTLGFNESATSTTIIETDVVFNNTLNWGSYRGPQQSDTRGYVFDFHRVALHEFGHVLGLDHPDQHGQYVSALMNSMISDLDHLTDDDNAGAAALYGLRITSSLSIPPVLAGNTFSYQISTNREGVSFSATGLPPGLQIDGTSGLISGIPSNAGTFEVLITATKAGATTSAILRIIVSAPAITSPLTVTIEIGRPLTYKITATNRPTLFGASGLPEGLKLDTGTGVISGTPTLLGSFAIEITATGSIGDARAKLMLVVGRPQITSPLAVTLQPGVPATYQIGATNRPTSFNALGLPPGLQLNSANGLISGTPTKPGLYRVTLKANAAVANASAIARFDVVAPWITSGGYAQTQIGQPFRYQVAASSTALSYGASGLPSGLHLNNKTGLISGVPTLSGNYGVLITAQTTFGEAAATITLSITPAPEVNGKPAASFAFYPNSRFLLADPARPRIYTITYRQLHVIDTVTLSHKTISLPYDVKDVSLSTDGRTLWLVPVYSYSLEGVDLETLTVLPDRPLLGVDPVYLREGLGHRFYLVNSQAQVVQLDGQTGAVTTDFGPSHGTYPAIELSADRRTLYVGDISYPSTMAVYDISTETPRLLEQTNQYPTSFRLLSLDRSGANLGLVDDPYYSTRRITIVPAGDITAPSKIFDQPEGIISMTFSSDGAFAFISGISRGIVSMFDTQTWKQLKTWDVGNDVLSVACDTSGSYLFVAGDTLRAYRINEPPTATPPNSLLNVSTRLQTQTGDRRMIGGFIIGGAQPKQVAIRALGPSLDAPGTLADPILEVYDSTGKLVAQNDNWNSTRQVLLDTKIAPRDEHEAATVVRLAPGSYTAVVGGVGQTAGVSLVEVYDLEPGSSSIANISTRGFVGTGQNVMIGGFILGGDQVTRVVVRSVGPSLSASGITGALLDTTLELHDGNGALIAQNDDWRSDQEQDINATGVPPGDGRESAIVQSLAPGGYTAIVRGKNDTQGVALVEVYNLQAK